MPLHHRPILVTLAAAVLLSSCSAGPDPETAVRQQMLTHFDLAEELRDHAIAGDLTRFRATARALAERELATDLPPDIFLQVGPLRHEAELASNARTVDAAARAAAEVARTCGDCHEANGVALPPAVPGPAVGPTTAQADLQTHMERLSRVTSRLWAGLAAPNASDWEAGSADLIALGGLPAGLEGLVAADQIDFVARRLRRLAEEARAATEPRYRVRALGEIWGTCADCHQQFGS
jgi:mono/diheme cytochrome c family protein